MTKQPPTPATRKVKKPRKYHIPFKEREYFSENLALLLKSSVPIGQAIDSLALTTSNKAMKKTLASMRIDIEAGFSLANALERSGVVGNQTLALVRLGEQSGRLVENLQLAAEQEEKRHMFRSKVRSALIYPVFVIGLTVIVGLGVSWFLLPRLNNTFTQLHVTLPLISQLMIQFGLFLQEHGVIAVPLFLLGCFLVGYILFGFKSTKGLGQRLLFRIPGVGRLMKEVEIAQFGYLLGTLLDAGLPITESIRLLARASAAARYQQFYMYLAEALDDGYSFRESLGNYKRSNKLLPPAVQQMVIAGESSGSLSEVLGTVGRTYEQKADTTTQNLEAIIEPILLIIVWIGVMLVAVAVIVPIYSLVGGLNQ